MICPCPTIVLDLTILCDGTDSYFKPRLPARHGIYHLFGGGFRKLLCVSLIKPFIFMKMKHECGIGGIINFNGLTQTDLQEITKIFAKLQIRGADASGVANSGLAYAKSGQPSSQFIKGGAYNKIKNSSEGKHWMVIHSRHATQGSPKNNANNHPISTDMNKFLVVHNGVVGTSHVREDRTRSDTWVIAQIIDSVWKKHSSLFDRVDEAYTKFWGWATISVITRNEIVIARRLNPLAMGRIKETGAIVFASTPEILHASKKVDNIEEIPDNTIIGWSSDGTKRRSKLPYVRNPNYVQNTFTTWWLKDESFDVEEPDDAEFKPIEESGVKLTAQQKALISHVKGDLKDPHGKGWWREPKKHSKASKKAWAKRRAKRFKKLFKKYGKNDYDDYDEDD